MSINRPGLLIIAGAALACLVALAMPAWEHWHELPAPPPAPLRGTLSASDDLTVGAGPDHPFGLALAPDGRRLAFPAFRGSAAHLWMRDLTTNETQALPGTEEGLLPFWSADGSQLGFFASGRLKVLTLATSQVSDLADAPAPRGGAWHPSGSIIYAPRADSALLEWQADGTVRPFTELDVTNGETSHRFPAILHRPGKPHEADVVYLVHASEATRAGLRTRSGVRLTTSDSSALVADGWLMYARGNALVAQRVEWPEEQGGKPTLVGNAQLLGTPVGYSVAGQLSATLGGDTLVYGAPQPALRDLRWFDRSDGTQSTLATQVQASTLRIAPTGGRVAVAQMDPQLGTFDIWTYEGGRLLPRRISQALDVDESPVWSPDAVRLVWIQARRALVSRGALAELPEQTLRKFDRPIRLWDWTPDGRSLVIGETRPTTRDDVLVLDARGAGDVAPYAASPFNEVDARVAPDGHWIAYASDESGQPEIYVDSFPVPGHRARLSTGGGSAPAWAAARFARPSPDTAELYFRRGSEVHAVVVSFAGERPVPLSTTRLFDAGGEIRAFDVAPDGQRFLVNVPSPGSRVVPSSLIVNWMTVLK